MITRADEGPEWMPGSRSEHVLAAPRMLLRLMSVNLVFFGTFLLVGAIALLGYLYTLEFEQIELSSGLRIERAGGIYSRSVQNLVAVAVGLSGASFLQFWTAHELSQRRRAALFLIRVCGLMLLMGAPAALVLWAISGPSESGEAGLVRQTLQDFAIGVRVVAALLAVQAALALVYVSASVTPTMRRWCVLRDTSTNTLLRWMRRMALGLWALVLVGLGVALGVLTDWIYELPVSPAAAGQLLYATSFDALNEEWDLFPGRDTVQVSSAPGESGGDAPLNAGVLQMTYGSGRSDEIVWTTLDRKFGDFDLRVTAQLLLGPVDQNQYGVVFRYRDADNFYMFLITADGYYSLQKVQSGIREKVSEWGLSEAIREGGDANEIRVVARGARFRFFVNGMPLPLCLRGDNNSSMWATWEGPGVCYTDELRYVFEDGAFAQGRIALVAGSIDGSDIQVAFDDLIVVGPVPESVIGPTGE